MSFPLPPLNLNSNERNDVGSGSSSPFDSMMPWNNIKNYNNHSAGATQNGSGSAEKSGGASMGGVLGGLNINLVLIVVAAVLILRK